MTFRPPRPLVHDTQTRTPAALLEHEFAQEMASALGRLGRALEAALAALRRFDAAHPNARSDPKTRDARRTLAIQARQALWLFIIQREACGLRDARPVLRDYRVPDEVFGCIGVLPPQQKLAKRVRKYR
jgi:hypothetical protein